MNTHTHTHTHTHTPKKQHQRKQTRHSLSYDFGSISTCFTEHKYEEVLARSTGRDSLSIEGARTSLYSKYIE